MFRPRRTKTLISLLIYEIVTHMKEQKISLFYIYSMVFDNSVCGKNCLKERILKTILQNCYKIFVNSDFSLDNV